MKMLRHHGISAVVDVGANVGQYGSELRKHGYSDRIISFEPTRQAYEMLTARARRDTLWIVNKAAIGEVDDEMTINVAANGAASSSMLPMLPLHEKYAPHARYIATEKVPVKALNTALDGLLEPGDRVLLKIDTQATST
jgi:FkbM family methyltransferase